MIFGLLANLKADSAKSDINGEVTLTRYNKYVISGKNKNQRNRNENGKIKFITKSPTL